MALFVAQVKNESAKVSGALRLGRGGRHLLEESAAQPSAGFRIKKVAARWRWRRLGCWSQGPASQLFGFG